MTWREDKVGSWSDFIEFVERLKLVVRDEYYWYFRGQSDLSWSLVPSLARELDEVSEEHALDIERDCLRSFMSEYHLHSPADGISKDKWSNVAWWMLMQHYSCPTRLLDWTRSPFVALYFVCSQLPEKDGVIWFFPPSDLQRLTEIRHGQLDFNGEELLMDDSKTVVYPVLAASHNRRLSTQQGVFTICNRVLSDHADVISDVFEGEESKNPLNKLIIPAGLKREFLVRLRTMNITPGSLFHGLDGLGYEIRDKARLRAWRFAK